VTYCLSLPSALPFSCILLGGFPRTVVFVVLVLLL
jgi:hypothetical protein